MFLNSPIELRRILDGCRKENFESKFVRDNKVAILSLNLELTLRFPYSVCSIVVRSRVPVGCIKSLPPRCPNFDFNFRTHLFFPLRARDRRALIRKGT